MHYFLLFIFALGSNLIFANALTQPEDLEKARSWRNEQVRELNAWHSTQLHKVEHFERRRRQWWITEEPLAKQMPVPDALTVALKEIGTESERLRKVLKNAAEKLSQKYNHLFNILRRHPLYPPQAEFGAYSSGQVQFGADIDNSFASEWKRHQRQYQSLAVLFEPIIENPAPPGTLENLSRYQEKQVRWVIQKNGKDMVKGPEQDDISAKINMFVAGSDVPEFSTNENGDLLYKGDKIQLHFYFRESNQSEWFDSESQARLVEKVKRQAGEVLDHRRQIATQKANFQKQQAALTFWSGIIAILKKSEHSPITPMAPPAAFPVEEKRHEKFESPPPAFESALVSLLPNDCSKFYAVHQQSANSISLHLITSDRGEKTIGFVQKVKMIACSGDALALVAGRFYFEGKVSANINTRISNASMAEVARGEASDALLLFERGELKVILKPISGDFMWLAADISKSGVAGFRIWRVGDRSVTLFLSSDGLTFQREFFKDPMEFGYQAKTVGTQKLPGGDL